MTSHVVGDLGPVYGFQWRHFGALYRDMRTDYGREGVDQITNLISTIKDNPDDRRMILCSWNPAGMFLLQSSEATSEPAPLYKINSNFCFRI